MAAIVKEGQGKYFCLPGICMTLKPLFDIPEEVMLRQEEWGTQSQELPALPWNTGSMG